MDQQNEKMLQFIAHLFNNNNIKNEPILIGEQLIVNFISKNLAVLKQTLTSDQFFPNLSIEQTLQLLLATLRDKVINQVKPELYKMIETIDFNVLNSLSDSETIAKDFIKEKFKQYLDLILTHKDARYNFNAVYNILKYGVLDKYVQNIFDRREFIFNEFTKVEKTNLKAEEFADYLKILLLIKNTAFVKTPFPVGSETKNLNYIDIQKVPKLLGKFFETIEQNVIKSLGGINQKAVKMSLKANCKQELTELEEASARFLYIITSRYQEYKHFEKIDRGAETPDKSWFNIAKKNFEYQGFDKKMIDELYKIAGDNNW